MEVILGVNHEYNDDDVTVRLKSYACALIIEIKSNDVFLVTSQDYDSCFTCIWCI